MSNETNNLNLDRIRQLAGVYVDPMTEVYGIEMPKSLMLDRSRLDKFEAAQGVDRQKLLYMWVKQGVVDFREFKAFCDLLHKGRNENEAA